MITGKTFFGGVNLSGVTLFDEINREELLYKPVEKWIMDLGVANLGVLGFLELPVLLSLWFLLLLPLGLPL